MKNKVVDFVKRISIFQVINIVLFLIVTVLITPVYETNDDQAMAYVAMGAYGERDFHLVFINVILGKLLVFLFSVFSGLNWYVVLYEVLVFTAITMLINIFEKKCEKKFAAFPIILIIYLFAVNYYYYVQFSKSAGLLPTVGLLYSVFLIEEKEERWYKYLVPGALIVLGSCYRFEVLYMVGFLFIPLLIYVFFKVEKKQKIFFFVYGALVCVMVFGLRIADRALYKSDEEWAYYLDYNQKRAKLTDYGWPNYQKNSEELTALGISLVDYENFQTWDFADRDLFDVEVLENLIAINERDEQESIWRKYCLMFIPGFLQYSFAVFLFLAVAYYFSHALGQRKIVGLLSIMAFFVAEMVLVLRGRFLIYRIDISVALALAVICYYLAVTSGDVSSNRKSQYLFIGVSCIAMLFAGKNVVADITEDWQAVARNHEINQLIRNDEDNYLIGTAASGVLRTNIWEAVDEGEYANIFRMGGWFTESPVFLNQMKAESIENLYQAFTTREDVYCVDSEAYGYKLSYLRENYDANAQMVLVKNINGYLIWKVVTEELQVDLSSYEDGSELLTHDISVSYTEDGMLVEGIIYEANTDSYKQNVYIVVCDDEMGAQRTSYATLAVNEMSTDRMNGRYADVTARMNGTFTGEEHLYILVENENGRYFLEWKE